MSYLPERFYSTDQIVRHAEGKTHFFSKGAMRFFNSRLGSNAYSTNNPFITLFVTSEKYENRYSGTSEPRYYTIRAYDWRTGNIDTVGDFQEYESSRDANKDARSLANQWQGYSIEDQHEYALLINAEYDTRQRRLVAQGYKDQLHVTEIV